jgi:DNA-directed RNA polymerase specialized sigma24 family protein
MYEYDESTGGRKKKSSYLDLFLDNTLNVKKRGIYFGEEHENAIIKYNNQETIEREKNELFRKFIEPAFRKIISGVLEMKMFRNLGKLNREDVIDNTFFRLIEKIHKFEPGMISIKTGKPVKAYSYFSTIAKNFILEQKVRHEKVLKNKADVETSIDLSFLSEDTLKMMSNYDKHEVELDDYETVFKNTKEIIIRSILETIHNEEKKDKKDSDLIKLGYCLKYLIEKWDKIEFMKKNEFMRILTLYTGFPHQKVSFLFKKFKMEGLKKLKPSLLDKTKVKPEEDEVLKISEEDDFDFDACEDFDDAEYESEIPEDYQINTFEEFEQQLYRSKFGTKRKKKKDKNG